MAYWNFIHNTLGIHVYWIGALVFGIVAIVNTLVHNHKQKKREKKFEEELNPEEATTEEEVAE